MSTQQKSIPKHFDCVSSNDGCDSTIDIISRVTGRQVASIPYWDEQVSAERTARKLAAALEAMSQGDLQLDITALLGEQRQIVVIWSIEDIQSVRADLTDDQAWSVLQLCRRVHDCNDGINRLLIETVAEDLFPAPESSNSSEGF